MEGSFRRAGRGLFGGGKIFLFFLNELHRWASKLSVKAEIRATPVQFFLCFLNPEHVARIIFPAVPAKNQKTSCVKPAGRLVEVVFIDPGNVLYRPSWRFFSLLANS
jgi:hypothetical protein